MQIRYINPFKQEKVFKMKDAPTPSSLEKTETLNIEQNNKKFLLLIKIQGENMPLIVSIPEEIGNPVYIKKLTLKEIKEKETHNLFYGLNSCSEFTDYLKTLAERKKLSINQKDGNLCINFNVEYLFKNYSIDFILYPEKKNTEDLIKDLCREVSSLKEKIKDLENKNVENLQNENKELKNAIKDLKDNNENLNREIKSLKEEIKEIKKIVEPIDKKFKENIINKHIFNNKSVIMKRK